MGDSTPSALRLQGVQTQSRDTTLRRERDPAAPRHRQTGSRVLWQE